MPDPQTNHPAAEHSTGRCCAFTIITNSYLPFARVLMASIEEHEPAWSRFVILADKLNGWDPALERFTVISSADLPINRNAWFHFKYALIELATGIKPYAFAHLAETFGFSRLVYFDPDIRLYQGLTSVSDALDEHEILLTPHLLAPLDDEYLPGELNILQAGTYNLGFLAARVTPNTLSFFRWWETKLYDHCYIDLRTGIFTDQKWLDLAPGLFQGVHILRVAGHNTAYWNVHQQPIALRERVLTAGGQPLQFFHFSGIDPADPKSLSRHQNRLVLAEEGPLTDLFQAYRQDVLSAGYHAFRSIPYAYDSFDNREAIIDTCRGYWQHIPDILDKVTDPFSDSGFAEYVRYWNSVICPRWRSDRPITRFAIQIYQASPQLLRQMPDLFGFHYQQYLDWFLLAGRSQPALPEYFLEPLRALRLAAVLAVTKDCGHDPGLPGTAFPAQRQQEALIPASWPPQTLSEWLAQPGTHFGNKDLTTLSCLIYEQRADLQNLYPDLRSATAAFTRWILTSGAREYGLSQEQILAVETLAVRSAGNRFGVLGRTFWDLQVRLFQAWRSIRRPAPSAGLQQLLNDASPAIQLLRYQPFAPDEHVQAITPPRGDAVRPTLGVNMIGYLQTESGVGENARLMARALQAAAIDFTANSVSAGVVSRQADTSMAACKAGFPFVVNLCHINADQTQILPVEFAPGTFEHRYNIGYWAWELESFPSRWQQAFCHYNEIWVPSSFIQRAIAAESPIPVLCMPPPIWIETTPSDPKRDTGSFTFLCMFDMLSIVRRKNPESVVEAFRLASHRMPNGQLRMKINNAHLFPDFMRELRARCDGLPIQILDRIVDRVETANILKSADCLVSLHRSEGFGLAIAEAMFLAKPVIATAYSGSMDFTKIHNSYLVTYNLTQVGPGSEPYPADDVWAEPDISHAAEQMILVYEDPDLRERRSREGQRTITEHFSPARIGSRVRRRLEQVHRRLDGSGSLVPTQ